MNVPEHFKKLFQSKDLTMNQKMMTLMAFMPEIPYNAETAKMWEDGENVGKDIKRLVDEGKIRLDGFDSDFILKVTEF
jgi:hypothetical protein|tara:strand:- start:116 stop:349 length:234 start_codon:yes stop_codon:yes gene_type:complete